MLSNRSAKCATIHPSYRYSLHTTLNVSHKATHGSTYLVAEHPTLDNADAATFCRAIDTAQHATHHATFDATVDIPYVESDAATNRAAFYAPLYATNCAAKRSSFQPTNGHAQLSTLSAAV